MLLKNQTIQLQIETVSLDGNGIGRYNDMVVFVPYSAAGDLLIVKIVKIKKSYAFGIIVDILFPSPSRISNTGCSSFKKCGGCTFRHIKYEEELRLKRNYLIDCLKRIGKTECEVLSIIPSPKENNYRNKTQLPVVSVNNSLQVGFYAQRSHRIIPFENGCCLQSEGMDFIADSCCELLDENNISAYDETSNTGTIRHIVIRKSSLDGSMMLGLVVNGSQIEHEQEFCKRITDRCPMVNTIVINENTKNSNVILGDKTRAIYKDGYIVDSLSGILFRLSLDSFFQINNGSAELLYKVIAEYANAEKNETLIDMYCGVGSIGLFMAKNYKNIIGIEINKNAVLDAVYNAALNNISNATFINADVKKACENLSLAGIHADTVVIDPPRKGCDPKTLNSIVNLSPNKIIVVSCNPATLARDLLFLNENGYLTEKVTPVDMFPRTSHVESVALVTKTGGRE